MRAVYCRVQLRQDAESINFSRSTESGPRVCHFNLIFYSQMPESSAKHNPTTSQLEHGPMTFILPGIADDPAHWEPLRGAFDCRIVSYLDWTEILDKSLASLVAHVTRQIQDAQPLGEIRLIGYSIGGQLGFAVTMALHSAGIPVSCLVLLDAGAEVTPLPRPLGRRSRELVKGLLSLVTRRGMATLVAKCLAMDSMRPLLYRLLRARPKRLPFDFDRYFYPSQDYDPAYAPNVLAVVARNHSIGLSALYSDPFVLSCKPCII